MGAGGGAREVGAGIDIGEGAGAPAETATCDSTMTAIQEEGDADTSALGRGRRVTEAGEGEKGGQRNYWNAATPLDSASSAAVHAPPHHVAVAHPLRIAKSLLLPFYLTGSEVLGHTLPRRVVLDRLRHRLVSSLGWETALETICNGSITGRTKTKIPVLQESRVIEVIRLHLYDRASPVSRRLSPSRNFDSSDPLLTSSGSWL